MSSKFHILKPEFQHLRMGLYLEIVSSKRQALQCAIRTLFSLTCILIEEWGNLDTQRDTRAVHAQRKDHGGHSKKQPCASQGETTRETRPADT